jgi:SAM-dependent methyltransferase
MRVESGGATSAAAFENRYRERADPWNFATSDYERNRYGAIMGSLLRTSYARGFEPGCSVGELTFRLAAICDELIAWDIAPSAAARARERCATRRNVDIRCADLAAGPPPGNFDLIVFSEMGYYFTPPQLEQITRSLSDRLNAEGEFVAAHWLGHSSDHVLHGDAVHAQLLANLPLHWVKGERHAGFRIDTWRS